MTQPMYNFLKLHKRIDSTHMYLLPNCQSNLFVHTYKFFALISITCFGFDIFGSFDSNFNLVHMVLIAQFASRFSYLTTCYFVIFLMKESLKNLNNHVIFALNFMLCKGKISYLKQLVIELAWRFVIRGYE